MSEELTIVEYELTDEEHDRFCDFVRKGFKDSLRKYLEEITSEVAKNHKNSTVVLSEKTLNPDTRSTRMAPLVLAALEGRLGIVNLFLEVFKTIIDTNHGSYLEYPDQLLLDLKQVEGFKTRGVTAINAACVNGFTDIAKKLVQFGGASINKPDYFGYSPLANAARYGRIDTVNYLLSRGADITHKTNDGYTVMHLAAMYGQHEVVQLMLAKMIRPMFPDIKHPLSDSGDSVCPCPMYLAASKGWQPVVDVFASHDSCPSYCKIDAQLLLGAAARMYWRSTSIESKQGIVDIWISSRNMPETRDIASAPIKAYGKREELKTEEELLKLLENPNFEEESLYQSLMIYERCLGPNYSYHWIFLAGIKMFERKHYKEAEELWKRAMNKHYSMAQHHVGAAQSNWQHDLKGTMQYMVKFSSSIETMVKEGYTPMWEDYVDYALQQLKIGILASLQSNLLNTSAGILKIYYSLLQIISCWIDREVGQPNLVNVTGTKVVYSEALQRAGQSFVDTAGVLTQTNLLHITIYPSAPLFRGTHWQSSKRIGGLLLGLINFGSLSAINDFDHCGNRPLHVAAKLPNRQVQEVVVAVLLTMGAHVDSLNRAGMTPAEVFKVNYPHLESCFPRRIPKLICLVAREIMLTGIEVNMTDYDSHIQETLRMHTLNPDEGGGMDSSWITLPTF